MGTTIGAKPADRYDQPNRVLRVRKLELVAVEYTNAAGLILTAEGAYYGMDKDGKPIVRITENFQNPTGRFPSYVETGVLEALGRTPSPSPTASPAVEDSAGIADVEVG